MIGCALLKLKLLSRIWHLSCRTGNARRGNRAHTQLVSKVTSQGMQLPVLLLGFVQLRLETYHLLLAPIHDLQEHHCQLGSPS